MIEYQFREEVDIPLKQVTLTGNLNIPVHAEAMIIFAHGSGSSRHSTRNRHVAGVLNTNGFATLLFDLLTPHEAENYTNRFAIELLSERLVELTHWLANRPDFELNIGYFGGKYRSSSCP